MKFNWIKFEEDESVTTHYKILSETPGEPFLAFVVQAPEFHPTFAGLWTGSIVTLEKNSYKALCDIPYFDTANQACFYAEVMILLNITNEEWLEYCRLEVEGAEDLHNQFFMNRAVKSLIKA